MRHGPAVRYGRIAAVAASATVTGVAVLGGLGVIATGAASQEIAGAVGAAVAPTGPEPQSAPREPDGRDESAPGESAPQERRTIPGRDADEGAIKAAVALPVDSGEGRRAVFSESRQRVWLVGEGDRVLHTYPVSGSVYDNLDPGTYEVWSRSEDAVGIDDSGTMKYFVRFAHGDTGAAIGFHDIPIDDGRPVQSVDELGTPLSHGCIRQKRSDARRMWAFAPIGSTVVVTP